VPSSSTDKVTRRIAVMVLAPLAWSPPGVDPVAWRLALADDVLDVLATLAEVDAGLAVEAGEADLAGQLGWPGMAVYPLPALDLVTVFAALAADGYEQAALLPADAPDLPGLSIAKLLRPLTTRPLAAAPVTGSDTGLLGLAATLPAPAWLPAVGLDDHTPITLRRLAPQVTDVAPAAGWHRIRSPADLGRLDPRVDGWDATRSLLSGSQPARYY
jgi:hypothetical protein